MNLLNFSIPLVCEFSKQAYIYGSHISFSCTVYKYTKLKQSHTAKKPVSANYDPTVSKETTPASTFSVYSAKHPAAYGCQTLSIVPPALCITIAVVTRASCSSMALRLPTGHWNNNNTASLLWCGVHVTLRSHWGRPCGATTNQTPAAQRHVTRGPMEPPYAD